VKQEVIEISSGDESEHKIVASKYHAPAASKKRSLSVTESSPSKKRQITMDTVEVWDSDDEFAEATSMTISSGRASSKPANQLVEVEDSGKNMASSGDRFLTLVVDQTAKDKTGRYILTQNVKVDSIEELPEVPARWPIPAAGVNVAYVIDLHNDKKWEELDTNSKKKKLDRFVKQEVCLIYSHVIVIHF